MSSIIHHAIVVTCFDKALAKSARARAYAIFVDGVSELSQSVVNAYWSFCVFPDGSKLGWPESDRGNERRDTLIDWLRSHQFRDGSSPFNWVEITYGETRANVARCDGDTPERRAIVDDEIARVSTDHSILMRELAKGPGDG